MLRRRRLLLRAPAAGAQHLRSAGGGARPRKSAPADSCRLTPVASSLQGREKLAPFAAAARIRYSYSPRASSPGACGRPGSRGCGDAKVRRGISGHRCPRRSVQNKTNQRPSTALCALEDPRQFRHLAVAPRELRRLPLPPLLLLPLELLRRRHGADEPLPNGEEPPVALLLRLRRPFGRRGVRRRETASGKRRARARGV